MHSNRSEMRPGLSPTNVPEDERVLNDCGDESWLTVRGHRNNSSDNKSARSRSDSDNLSGPRTTSKRPKLVEDSEQGNPTQVANNANSDTGHGNALDTLLVKQDESSNKNVRPFSSSFSSFDSKDKEEAEGSDKKSIRQKQNKKKKSPTMEEAVARSARKQGAMVTSPAANMARSHQDSALAVFSNNGGMSAAGGAAYMNFPNGAMFGSGVSMSNTNPAASGDQQFLQGYMNILQQQKPGALPVPSFYNPGSFPAHGAGYGAGFYNDQVSFAGTNPAMMNHQQVAMMNQAMAAGGMFNPMVMPLMNHFVGSAGMGSTVSGGGANMLGSASSQFQMGGGVFPNPTSAMFSMGGVVDSATSPLDGLPLTLPQILVRPGDEPKLSNHQLLLRRQIEAFIADEDDATTHTRGRNKPIMVGQVGIRCRHCKHLPILRRQKGATYYPNSLLGIYQAAQNMNTVHMQCGLCTEMPEEIKKQFAHSICFDKVHQSGAGRPYWAESAKKLGLVDTENHGIRFIRNIPPDATVTTSKTGKGPYQNRSHVPPTSVVLSHNENGVPGANSSVQE